MGLYLHEEPFGLMHLSLPLLYDAARAIVMQNLTHSRLQGQQRQIFRGQRFANWEKSVRISRLTQDLAIK